MRDYAFPYRKRRATAVVVPRSIDLGICLAADFKILSLGLYVAKLCYQCGLNLWVFSTSK